MINTCIQELTGNKDTSKEIVFINDPHKTNVNIDKKIKDILSGIEVNLER